MSIQYTSLAGRIALAAIGLTLATPAHADHPGGMTGTGGAGGITVFSPGTPKQGSLSVGLESEYIRSDAFSDAALVAKAADHIHAHSVDYTLTTALSASYGLTDSLMVSLRLPYIYRDNIRHGHHSHGPGGNTVERHGDSGGMGDPSLVGQYQFLQQSAHGIDAAALLGVKVPLGTTRNKNNGELQGAEFQPGSGSVDGMGGLALAKTFGSVTLGGSFVYIAAGKGTQETDLGDRTTSGISIAYRLGGEAHDHGHGQTHQHAAWDLILEGTADWSDKKVVAGETEEDSGGSEYFVSPGVRYTAEAGWSAFGSVSLPVASDLGRGHTDTAVKIRAGIGRSF